MCHTLPKAVLLVKLFHLSKPNAAAVSVNLKVKTTYSKIYSETKLGANDNKEKQRFERQ